MRPFVLLLGWVAACSTDTFSTDGGADATSDAPQPDAAPGDATGFEAAPPVEAGVDAEPPFSCSPPELGTLICDDFESSSNVASKWTAEFTTGGGAAMLDNGVFVSPSHSALFTTPAASAGLSWANLFYQAAGITTSKLELQADIRVSSIDTQPIPLLRIAYTAPNSSGTVNYDLTASAGELAFVALSPLNDGGFDTDSQVVGTLPTNVWFNARYEVDTSAMLPYVTVWIAGSQKVGRTFAVPPPVPSDQYRTINVGLVYETGGTVGGRVNYDNVNFRAF